MTTRVDNCRDIWRDCKELTNSFCGIDNRVSAASNRDYTDITDYIIKNDGLQLSRKREALIFDGFRRTSQQGGKVGFLKETNEVGSSGRY